MTGLNQALGRDKDIDTTVRIGIAPGMVMVGEARGEATAHGDRRVPNMAASCKALPGATARDCRRAVPLSELKAVGAFLD